MAIINSNGTVQVFNNVLLQLNGSSSIEVQDYITSLRWTTGGQSDHVLTIKQQATPLTVNQVNSRPSGSITFVAGAFPSFYLFLNNRNVPFNLEFIYYTTGDLSGPKQTIIISNILLDGLDGSVEQSNVANLSTFGFKATDVTFA